jgi:hypothetical protein
VNTKRGLDQVPRVSLWDRSELIRRAYCAAQCGLFACTFVSLQLV